MYKTEQKDIFILDYLNNRVVSETMVKSIFRYTEAFEAQLDKDVSLFTQDEIIKMLKEKHSRSLTSLQNVVVVLKHYTTFIIATGRENSSVNNYSLINKDVLRECIDAEIQNKMILTKEELHDVQDQMLNATDKAILECLFEGISGPNLDDLTGLCAEQLDKINNRIYLSGGRVIQISKRLCDLLTEAFDETEIMSYGESMILTPVTGRGKLYKAKPNAHKEATPERKYRWVLRRMVIWRKYFNMPVLTAKSISTSGLVYEIKEALQNTELSLREWLKTKQGEEIARRRGFKAVDYVDVLYESVVNYI